MGQSGKPASRPSGPNGAGRRIYDLLRGQIADGTLAADVRPLRAAHT